MNQYPVWKYLLLVIVMITGILYALPNIYGDEYAVQVGAPKGLTLTDQDQLRIESLIKESGVSNKGVERDADRIVVRYNSPDEQLKAKDYLFKNLPGYSVALNMVPATPSWMSLLPGKAEPMALGLDLSGGIHLLFEVDIDSVIQQRMNNFYEEVRTFVRKNQLGHPKISYENNVITLTYETVAKRDKVYDDMYEEFRDLTFSTEDLADGSAVTIIAFDEASRKEIEDSAIRQNISTLSTRVNSLGVAEPVVQRQGRNRIVVELPGVQDPAQIKNILGAIATLEFRMVDQDGDQFLAAKTGQAPPGSILRYQRNGTPVLLQKKVMLTGEYITDAGSDFDNENGGAIVNITLNNKGGDLFYNATKENVGKPMGIVFIDSQIVSKEINGEVKNVREKKESVISVATIRQALSYRFQISGLDSAQEAKDLALLLRAGSLAAPLELIEERTVGPAMGEENIESGLLAVVIGFLLVVVFMAVYYRAFGLFANVALVANLVLIVAILSIIQATVTLPGIAAIVLTVGMAVDANVLIFERIREELLNGLSPHAAVNAGYDRAFMTILDANITTLIAAVVLVVAAGSGPVMGFALTLIIGILTSMFTAIMGTRALVNIFYGKRKLSKLAI